MKATKKILCLIAISVITTMMIIYLISTNEIFLSEEEKFIRNVKSLKKKIIKTNSEFLKMKDYDKVVVQISESKGTNISALEIDQNQNRIHLEIVNEYINKKIDNLDSSSSNLQDILRILKDMHINKEKVYHVKTDDNHEMNVLGLHLVGRKCEDIYKIFKEYVNLAHNNINLFYRIQLKFIFHGNMIFSVLDYKYTEKGISFYLYEIFAYNELFIRNIRAKDVFITFLYELYIRKKINNTNL